MGNFGIKYVKEEDRDYLIIVSKHDYKITIDLGGNIVWTYAQM